MDAPETARDRARRAARRAARRVAAELGRTHPDPTDRIDAAARLLAQWPTDEEIRTALRPVFAEAISDQRALIALGDIDAWLPDGRIARGRWETAALGPDPALAAEAAWKAGCAHRRAGRRAEAAPFLRQAAAGGWTQEAEARRQAERARQAREAARREGDRLRRAERCIDTDDLAGADDLLDAVERPDRSWLAAWEQDLRGELAFRRGHLDEAEDYFGAAAGDRDGRRRRELRLAQLAILRGDATEAYERTEQLTDPDDQVSVEARQLLVVHADLIASGLPVADGMSDGCDCCCEDDCDCEEY